MSLRERIKSVDSLVDSLPVSRDFLTRLGVLSSQVARKVAVQQVSVDSGSLADLHVEQVTLGSATINQVKVEQVSATLQHSQARLQQVRSLVELGIRLDWEINLGWIGKWDGSDSLGSIDVPVALGNIDIPNLDDIQLQIPSINIPSLVAEMAPLKNLDLGELSLGGVKLKELGLPAAGLSLSGMGVGELSLSSLNVPAVDGSTVQVAEAAPSLPLILPGASLQGVTIPAVNLPSVSSGSFDASATASARQLSVDLGILKITLTVTPTVHLEVGQLVLTDSQLSASLGKVSLDQISLPVSAKGISGKALNLQGVAINNLTF